MAAIEKATEDLRSWVECAFAQALESPSGHTRQEQASKNLLVFNNWHGAEGCREAIGCGSDEHRELVNQIYKTKEGFFLT